MSNNIETPAPAVQQAVDPRLLVREQGFSGYISEFKRKIRGGELGSLPVIIGLIVIWAAFAASNGNFLSASNFEYIAYYMVGIGTLSIGLVFVLLLGEIDLSVGSVSGLAAAIFAVLSVTHGVNLWLATLAALATGAVIGAIHGFVFAKIGVPAFVVTLAGFLGWNGLMLWLLGDTGTINLPDTGLIHLFGGNSFFLNGDISGAYILAAVGVAAMLFSSLSEQGRRRRAKVPFRPTSEVVLRTAVLAVAAFGSAYVLNLHKGVPNNLVFFLAALIICDFVLRRTSYGRKIFAVGGNIEASRRAGINVAAIRISVYSIAGFFAALGGLVISATISSANQGGSDPNNLMMAIAAAVIGGTSLFGGRGKVWSALLGMLVIESINAGLFMLGEAQSVQYMITGGVLLAAVVVDSLSRRTQKSSGRA
ncbi:sugar ABC transporter permease [Streptacidiphilus carbonis]|uniref:sugar ABC transporter permease n=1 Tax=Streptacidiphilus carbonis TaxID=105422 RepID=UPI0005A9AB4A|nr:ABC transporter permease [Streptacidiphilus carbonis]